MGLGFPELAPEERHRIMETVDFREEVHDAWAEHCEALGLYLPPEGYAYEDRGFLDA